MAFIIHNRMCDARVMQGIRLFLVLSVAARDECRKLYLRMVNLLPRKQRLHKHHSK